MNLKFQVAHIGEQHRATVRQGNSARAYSRCCAARVGNWPGQVPEAVENVREVNLFHPDGLHEHTGVSSVYIKLQGTTAFDPCLFS